jgi:two-component system nitrogen regulation response regulator GlnG
MRIFIVDDDATLRGFVKRWLTSLDRYELWIFDNGVSAIEALADQSPCVLLSDLDMPGASGEDVAQAAARLPRPPHIVLMSGDHDRLQKARGLAQATLEKPFSFRELLSIIEPAAGFAGCRV